MKRTLPLILGFAVGTFVLLAYFVNQPDVAGVKKEFLRIGQLLAAAAYILGGISILQVNLPKIRRRETDWQFKVILLLGAAVMMFSALPGFIVDSAGVEKGVKVSIVEGQGNAKATLDLASDAPLAATISGSGLRVDNKTSYSATHIFNNKMRQDLVLQHQQKGYESYKGTILIDETGPRQTLMFGNEFLVQMRPGDQLSVNVSPAMKWDKEGRVFNWLYDYVFAPCNATMFSLLAFFIASAAFRAFRAHNLEAGILLGTAIFVLLGRATIGQALHPVFPQLADWIINIPNNAGYRAIMMGAALGGIATGLRIILGLERSHLGGDA